MDDVKSTCKFFLPLLIINSVLYCFLGANIILNIFTIISFFIVLLLAPEEYAFYALLFFAPWDRFSVMPKLSYLTILELLLVLRTIFFFVREKMRIRLIDFVVFIALIMYGYYSYKQTGKVTVFRMAIVVLFSIRFKMLYEEANEEGKDQLLSKLFLTFTATALISNFYGVVYFLQGGLTVSRRLGVIRFTNTLGCDRSGLLNCLGMIYPLYFDKHKTRRTLILVLLVICSMLTVSLTTIGTLVVFFVVHYFVKYKKANNKRKMRYLVFFVFFAIVLICIWNFGTGISFIDNVFQRIKDTLYYLQIGDYSAATTTRSNIIAEYQLSISNFSKTDMLFGTGYTSYYTLGLFSHYTHNTYIDMYVCFGILGIALITIRLLKNIIWYKKIQPERAILFMLLTISCLVPGLGVSALAESYWFLPLLLI